MATETLVITASSDDAHESADESVFNSGVGAIKVEGHDSNETARTVAGFRFVASVITAADTVNSSGSSFQLTSLNASRDNADVIVYGHKVINAPTFSTSPAANAVVARLAAKTTASMNYDNLAHATSARADVGDTPGDIAAILNEVMALPSWDSTKVFAILVEGQATSVASWKVISDGADSGGDDTLDGQLIIDYTPASSGAVSTMFNKYTLGNSLFNGLIT